MAVDGLIATVVVGLSSVAHGLRAVAKCLRTQAMVDKLATASKSTGHSQAAHHHQNGAP